MTRQWFKRCLSSVLCLFFALSLISIAKADELSIVLNSDIEVKTLSRNALRSIFGMRLRHWPSGATIKVFVLPDRHPLHIAFCKRMLRVFPHQMRWSWDRLVYSGTGQAPLVVQSEEEMHAKLAVTPGAIGYLRSEIIDDSIHILSLE